MALRFLLDENICNEPLRKLFESLGHEVDLVTSLLSQGSPDKAVCDLAEQLGAIVVTKNGKDFRRILGRQPNGSRYRAAGYCIDACADDSRFRDRLSQFIKIVAIERDLVDEETDKRVLVEVGKARLILTR